MAKRTRKARAEGASDRIRIDVKDFIKQWRTEKTVAEIAEHFGVSRMRISQTAQRLRGKGVKLDLKRVGRTNMYTKEYVQELNSIGA